jgi:hypothetical protein
MIGDGEIKKSLFFEQISGDMSDSSIDKSNLEDPNDIITKELDLLVKKSVVK